MKQNHPAMYAMIENLVNGNCTDARKAAKRHSYTSIFSFCMVELEWTSKKAHACAYFLKTGDNFQAYCDAPDFDPEDCLAFTRF